MTLNRVVSHSSSSGVDSSMQQAQRPALPATPGMTFSPWPCPVTCRGGYAAACVPLDSRVFRPKVLPDPGFGRPKSTTSVVVASIPAPVAGCVVDSLPVAN
jgi:hypothetical protein